MSEPTIRILLPKTLYLLRDKAGQIIPTDSEEWNIYYKNILSPFDPQDDILVRCEYGCNYGDRWCINTYPHEIDAFPLTIQIYDPYGRKKAEKTVTVRLQDKHRHTEPLHVLCIGDSMTRSQVYIEHLAMKLHNLRFVGTRSYNGTIFHEGRGGWAFSTYFENTEQSPFLFPAEADGKTYAGDWAFWQQVADPAHNSYVYDGFDPYEIQPGETYLRDGQWMRRTETGEECLSNTPEMVFDFGKYIARHPECTPDAISILMGANDLQLCSYEDSAMRVAEFIQNMHKMIDAIRRWSPDVPIILNLPIIGGDSYSWGKQLGCAYGAKLYDFNIKAIAASMLREFDGRENENLYLSPMLASIDPVYGFPRETHKVNRYSEVEVSSCANWVHPSAVGYKQMGDTLGGVLTLIHNRKSFK